MLQVARVRVRVGLACNVRSPPSPSTAAWRGGQHNMLTRPSWTIVENPGDGKSLERHPSVRRWARQQAAEHGEGGGGLWEHHGGQQRRALRLGGRRAAQAQQQRGVHHAVI